MKELAKKHWRKITAGLIAVAIIVAIVAIYWQPITAFFGDHARIKGAVERAGIWGPLVFIAIQFLQIVFAPIPGQVAGVIAGSLFGPWLGTLYSLVGSVLGCFLVFTLSRKLGRPFVERFVDKKHLKKFDRLTKNAGPMVFFLIFLLPGFPDDIICYLAGLSAIPIRTLVIITILGRAPGYILSGFLGAGIGEANTSLIVSIVVLLVIGAAIAYWQRDTIKQWARQFTREDESDDT